MEPTIPITDQNDQSSGTQQVTEQPKPDHSEALQARFNELTGQLKARDAQIDQLVQALAQKAVQPTQQVQTEPTLPEGLDPNVAGFFKTMFDSKFKELETRTQQMLGQVVTRQEVSEINQRYAHLPEDVRAEATGLYNHIRKKYPDASMDDAVRMTLGERALKQSGNISQRQQFNQIPGAIRTQGAPPSNTPRTGPVPPTQREDWDSLDYKEQNKLIDNYEKETGKKFYG